MPPTMQNILNTQFPIGVVAVMVLQVSVFTWWGAGLKNDLAARVLALENHAKQVDRLDESRATHEMRIIVLEQMANRVREDLVEIKAILRQNKTGELRERQPIQQPQ